ncbi:MAG: MBL fold metallo-hydrolase, partial [Candidatus Aminicenantes bacterium]
RADDPPPSPPITETEMLTASMEKLILAPVSFIKESHKSGEMAEVHFLGTGGSVATRERDNTSLLLSEDDSLVLVDCPGSVIQKIKKLNFDPRRISSILITHIHPDHIYGLPSLVHSLMLEECLIPLYGSPESIQFSKALLDLFRLREEKIKTRIRFEVFEQNKAVRLSPSMRVSCVPVPHDSSSLAFHFYFEEKGRELVYSGDSSPHIPLFQRAGKADCLIHDCSAPSRFFRKYPSLHKMHTHALELGQLAAQAEVKFLIPCHFFGELDFSVVEIEKEIRENYTGKLVIPRDFIHIEL